MPCPRTQQANLPTCSPQPPVNAEQGSYRYHFLKSFGMTRQGNEPQVYRLRSERSNHHAIASVLALRHRVDPFIQTTSQAITLNRRCRIRGSV